MNDGDGRAMREVLRTNDPIRLSYAEALLREAGLAPLVFDAHASVMDGSVLFVQRRLMVADDDADAARAILAAGLAP